MNRCAVAAVNLFYLSRVLYGNHGAKVMLDVLPGVHTLGKSFALFCSLASHLIQLIIRNVHVRA